MQIDNFVESKKSTVNKNDNDKKNSLVRTKSKNAGI